LKLKCDQPLSSFTFDFNLRRYTEGYCAGGPDGGGGGGGGGSGGGGVGGGDGQEAARRVVRTAP
jgi:hypothetical protein